MSQGQERARTEVKHGPPWKGMTEFILYLMTLTFWWNLCISASHQLYFSQGQWRLTGLGPNPGLVGGRGSSSIENKTGQNKKTIGKWASVSEKTRPPRASSAMPGTRSGCPRVKRSPRRRASGSVPALGLPYEAHAS